ncbi:hypothetical protein ACFQV2_06150 [Actinokineospora soli]|uniref:Caspase domain-containing protein n=1 Tax=Actinokineospora soli TaxID=1048753 RepID=A0ABW2TKC3_9PSEU
MFEEMGLTELSPSWKPPPTQRPELTHVELRDMLDAWGKDCDENSTDCALVIYVTGHGTLDEEDQWRLAPEVIDGGLVPETWIEPRRLLRPVISRPDVQQCLLILDACYAEDGARSALSQTLQIAPKVDTGSTGLWIIAAATRSQEAEQGCSPRSSPGSAGGWLNRASAVHTSTPSRSPIAPKSR